MEEPTGWILLVVLLLFSCFVAQSFAKTQSEALNKLYNSKFYTNSGIDKHHFSASDYTNGVFRVESQEGLKERDRIKRLPGQPDVEFEQYGGYIKVNQTAGRALYYYFVEALPSNKSLPLLLWLNGGPGCSSLAYGAMQELGPFRVHSDGKTLYKNKFAWNNGANVLFLESPAGVGFSYSNTTTDYERSGDKNTASDNYIFLLNWLERFPEYKGREFYISGESYAGHYVPQLAHNIIHHNNTFINLKGIIIGNAVIDDETDLIGMLDYFASHALISDQTNLKIQKYCNFSSNAANQSNFCNEATNDAGKNIKNINIYNIYASLCSNSSLTTKPKQLLPLDFDPCSDYYVIAYMNRPDVQEALHANVTSLNFDWSPCSDVIKHWRDSPSTIIPLLKEFIENGLRVWIFSGDIDGRIPITSTKYSINKMKLEVTTPWHPWFLNGEVGGYAQVFEGKLTLATVRGAGHQVPSYQPERALLLITHYLTGKDLPSNPPTH